MLNTGILTTTHEVHLIDRKRELYWAKRGDMGDWCITGDRRHGEMRHWQKD